MKTQISIQVKNENIISRMQSSTLLSLFKKRTVKVYVDGATEALELKARKEPYVLDMEPGQHLLLFEAKARKNYGAMMMAGAFGAGLGLGGGGMYEAASFAKGAMDIVSAVDGSNRVKDNQLQCTLREGDILKVCIQPKRNGVVKVKLL